MSVDVGSTTLNIVEVNLRKPAELKSLTLSTIGTEPAFGIISVVGEVGDSKEVAAAKAIQTLFSDWHTEGDAFSIGAVDRLFKNPTFNSLAAHGESATGKAFSPTITMRKDTLLVKLQVQGGDIQGGELLHIDFIDPDTKELYKRHAVHGNHHLRRVELEIPVGKGRRVQMGLIDDSTAEAYAWLGIADFKIDEK